MKLNVWLAQINFQYGEASLFLPYSVGCLEAYARAQGEINEAFEFKGYVYRREPITDVIARIEQSGGVDVLGISCYIWNWEYSRALAGAVRARFPGVLIVIGGPQVPRRTDNLSGGDSGGVAAESTGVVKHLDDSGIRTSAGGDRTEDGGVGAYSPFRDFECADIAVFGEGERAFAEILRAYAIQRGAEYHGIFPGGNLFSTYGAITGLAIRSDVPGSGGAYVTGEPGRISDLAQLPSPYLTGCFDALLADTTTDWQASIESNRGCPYSCSFCACNLKMSN